MRILYGTTNQGKLEGMRSCTQSLGLEIIGLKELNRPLPVVEESGKDPLENAELKARAYYSAFSMPVFSCDSGLYFDGLEESLQPGIYTRRVHGKELTDEEMLDYYSNLAKEHHDQLVGRYRNAIYLILNDEVSFCSMDESLETEPFLLVSKPHEKRVAGLPLDSLSVDLRSGKYYHDLEEGSVEAEMEEGFRRFFEKVLSSIQDNA